MQLEQSTPEPVADRMEDFANVITCRWLVCELAEHHGFRSNDMATALGQLPINMLPLLATPQGHTLLGYAVGGLLPRMNDQPYTPTIH